MSYKMLDSENPADILRESFAEIPEEKKSLARSYVLKKNDVLESVLVLEMLGLV